MSRKRRAWRASGTPRSTAPHPPAPSPRLPPAAPWCEAQAQCGLAMSRSRRDWRASAPARLPEPPTPAPVLRIRAQSMLTEKRTRLAGIAFVLLSALAWSLNGLYARVLTVDVWTTLVGRAMFTALTLLILF